MTLIRRRSPFDELFTLGRVMDRFFDDETTRPRTWRAVFAGADPALDVVTTPDELVITASLPGWKPEDVDITLTGTTLTIAGELKEESRRQDESWVVNEIRRGSFSRAVELPEGLIGDRATASFDNGLLTLHIPKAEEIKPRQIRISATGAEQPVPERELAGSNAR